jgi:hypothetical protein
MNVSIKRNGYTIKIWWSGWSSISIYIDDKFLMAIYVSYKIYDNVINPLIDGNEDILECLKLIASRYKDIRTRTKYVKALANIGVNIKKWIGRRPGAYLKRQADLVYENETKKLLGFLCNNGWIVVDIKYKDVYACIERNGGYSIARLDYDPITLADKLPALRHDLRIIQFLSDEYQERPNYWMIKIILETIPKEWWKPLDIDALILEYQLKQL